MKRANCLVIPVLLAVIGLFCGCAEMNQAVTDVNKSVSEIKLDTPKDQATTEKKEAAETKRAVEEKKESKKDEKGEESSKSSPVNVTLDGVEASPDTYAIYWDSKSRVSDNPQVKMSADSSLGDFQSCIINLYEADKDGKELGKPWAITDFGAGEKTLVVDKAYSLCNPGGGATILSPEGTRMDKITLKSGQTYISLFVVTGSKGSHTHKVRFTVK